MERRIDNLMTVGVTIANKSREIRGIEEEW
jgi:hypothetical protein